MLAHHFLPVREFESHVPDCGVAGKGVHERPVAVSVGVGPNIPTQVVEATIEPGWVQVVVGVAEDGGKVGGRPTSDNHKAL